MIKNELKNLWHNKLMLIVVIAVVIIPLIYAGLFLKSMWDPYGNVEHLPVAVVNNDQPVEYEGETLQVGKDLEDELRENDSLAFNFVDADAAKQGLKNGTFYMVITIPENFSKNASTLMDDKPEKMELTYETNPGTNYIASKMSESALTKIKDSVSAEVTKTYTKTIFEKFTDIGDGMQDAADGALELKEGIEDAATGTDTIATNLNTLASGANDLLDGSNQLTKGIQDYTNGASKLDSGAGRLDQGATDLQSGADTLKTGTKTYVDGVNSLADGITAYVAGADQLAAGAKQLSGLSALSDVYDGISSAQSGAAQLDAGLTQLSGALPSEQTLNGLSGMVTSSVKDLQTASSGLSQVSGGLSQLASGVDSAASGVNAQIAAANKQLEAAAKVLEDAGEDEAAEEVRSKKIDSVASATLVGTIQKAGETINTGKGIVDQAATGIGGAADKFGSVSTMVSTLRPAVAQLNAGSKQLSEGLTTLKEKTSSFPAAAEGIKSLNAGFATLTANNETLKSGAATLKENGSTLTGGTASLAAGAKSLKAGTKELVAGTKELTSNNETLVNGATQLADGATQIADGSTKLYDGSVELQDGMNKLQDGSDELHDAIQDGADEVKEVDSDDDTYEMFASPVEDEETKITTVENNGHAMAPYMMSVGLWVGCLAFCLIYPLMSYKGELKSGLAWWASKAAVLYPVAILQGVILITMLNKLAGFHPVEYGKTIAFACLAAITFTSIMYFFNIWLGKVGSFLMLVFMVVQLAGSAGTYPVELSPAFVSKIHKYVPFTYTVDAFRSTICGGESIHKSVIVLASLFVIFTTLTIISFQIKTAMKRKGKILVYDWLEERGLA